MRRCSGQGVPRDARAPLALCLLARQRPPGTPSLSSRHQRPFGTWSIYSDPTRPASSLVLPSGFDWPTSGWGDLSF